MHIRSRCVRLLGPCLILMALCLSSAASAAAAGAAPAELMPEEGFPYQAFDRLPADKITVAGAELTVALGADGIALGKEDILAWVRKSAEAVDAYYGRFPVTSARILLIPVDGAKVRSGSTWGYHGAATRIMVGRDVTRDALMHDDWVLVHEMIHMALPDMTSAEAWLSEGIAVYVESISRVQAGHLPEAQIWHDFVRDMPKGEPRAGDQGLEGADSWGRIYWGGALFCLVADVEIRKRSGDKLGLQAALRGIDAVTNHTEDGDIARVLALGDKATGEHVLSELYESMGRAAAPVDLEALWRGLGVRVDGDGNVTFDDTAPLAGARRAIVRHGS